MAVEESVLYFEGKYSPDRRFVIHNWTTEDFKSFWDSRPVFIKAGEMYECDHAVAVKLTKEIVDREMFKAAEQEYKNAGDNKQFAEKMRERAEMATLSRQMRKPYEDKTITEIKAGEENPIMAKMRAEIRAEEQAKLNAAEKDIVNGSVPKIETPNGSISNDKAVDQKPTEFADK